MKTRRQALGLIGGGAAALALGQLPTPALGQSSKARIVIVGGGFGGATTARYLKTYAPKSRSRSSSGISVFTPVRFLIW